MTEPLRSHKFTVDLLSQGGRDVRLGLMQVTGLSEGSGALGGVTFTRGVVPGNTVLYDWLTLGTEYAVSITVAGLVRFSLIDARPSLLYYSALDAGESNAALFTENLIVSYKLLEVSHNGIRGE
jgi:hypothetical protein